MAANLAGKALFHIIQSMKTCWFLPRNGGIMEAESDLHVSPSPPALSIAIVKALSMAIVKGRTSYSGSGSDEV